MIPNSGAITAESVAPADAVATPADPKAKSADPKAKPADESTAGVSTPADKDKKKDDEKDGKKDGKKKSGGFFKVRLCLLLLLGIYWCCFLNQYSIVHTSSYLPHIHSMLILSQHTYQYMCFYKLRMCVCWFVSLLFKGA